MTMKIKLIMLSAFQRVMLRDSREKCRLLKTTSRTGEDLDDLRAKSRQSRTTGGDAV